MLSPNQTFSHFRIVQKLGEGGMGEVYLAEDQKLNRQVALKTLRDDYFDNLDFRERFEREAKTAAQISHSNVMAIYDIGVGKETDSGRDISYIVMEYVKGVALTDYLSKPTCDTATLTRLAEKIASGLAAAHALNIVHRDIKAENIIINENEEPKILDFGLAKPMTPLQAASGPVSGATVKAELSRIGTVVGTVSYMSPEQARGETVDARSDIFSFGVLLYKMFVGEMPFTGSSQVSILAKILEAQHPSPHTKKEGIDPEIERIIDKCLQKSASDRYQDTRDLVVDLRNLRRQYDSGISTTSASVANQIDSAIKADRKKQRRNRLIRIGAVLVVFISVLFWQNNRIIKKIFGVGTTSTIQAGEYRLAILGFVNKTGDPQLDWLSTGLPEILITDLSQDQGVFLINKRRLLDQLGGKENVDLNEFTYEQQVTAAKKLGAVNVLSGVIFKVGEKIRIDVRLEDVASGNLVLADKVSSSDPMSLVDSLANKMASALNMKQMANTDKGVTQLTTASAEAYKFYHLGMQKFDAELYPEAIKFFEKAISIDSTFALPYMRIGMSNVFDGKMQSGVPYFAKAMKYASHLPIRDRNLLDAYADIWFTQQINSAVVKLRTLASNYPEDPEIMTFGAIVAYQINHDTTGAIKILENVLKSEPKFSFARGFLLGIYQDIGEFDKAIELAKELKNTHPESPSGDKKLGYIYTLQGKFDDAIAANESILKINPNDPDALLNIEDIYIRKRDFNKAIEYLERYKIATQDDPFLLREYYKGMANVCNWSGKFLTGLKYRYTVLDISKQSADSSRVLEAYGSMYVYFQQFGFPDSAIYYCKQSAPWTPYNSQINFPVALVSLDSKYADSIKPEFDKDMANLRGRLPSDLQGNLTQIERVFDGLAKHDTTELVEAYEVLSRQEGASNESKRAVVALETFAKRYAMAKVHLEKWLYGKDLGFNGSGYYYPYCCYLLGVCNEGLGDKKAAVKNYQEVLRYWGNPEIEIPTIKDAKSRLAKLMS